MLKKVRLTVIRSECRCKCCTNGDVYIVDDVCPPLCHELWQQIYPMVYALGNGAEMDCGNSRQKQFDAVCPDEGRVRIHGQVMED